MSKEKQIEEMAKLIHEAENNRCHHRSCLECKYGNMDDPLCTEKITAEYLYEEGYHKQSEWISVDERLPDRFGYYLGCTYKGGMLITPFFPVFANDKPEFHYKIAYWMPLPEAPKGGEE